MMHTQPSQANMNTQYELVARHKVKREIERVNGSSANNKICFKVRAPSSTSPPSTHEGFLIHWLVHKELSQGVPNSSLYNHNLLLEASSNQSPHNLRD